MTDQLGPCSGSFFLFLPVCFSKLGCCLPVICGTVKKIGGMTKQPQGITRCSQWWLNSYAFRGGDQWYSFRIIYESSQQGQLKFHKLVDKIQPASLERISLCDITGQVSNHHFEWPVSEIPTNTLPPQSVFVH